LMFHRLHTSFQLTVCSLQGSGYRVK
jgi:hypothetical protein